MPARDNKKSVICLVIPTLQAGGMERVMSEIAEYFAFREQLEIHLILYGISREVFYHNSDKIIRHVPSFTFNYRYRLFHTLRTMLFLRNTIRKINPDSILSFGEVWNSFVLISLLGLKCRVFVSDRCQPYKKLGIIHDRLREIMYPRAAGIIAQTQKAEEFYRWNLHCDNVMTIGNPIRRIDKRDNIVSENIVLSVGRLINTKHHDKLIEMFLNILKPGWKLVIVGYDHLKQNTSEKLKHIIEQYNAGSFVKLEGKQADVESYYLKSKIFAFTSSSEGFPNAIGEAMSAGLPVIAFDCIAGPSEMIRNNQNGFLIPLFDYNKFQEKLEELMDNDDLRAKLGAVALDDIKFFSIENIGERYLHFLLS